MYIYKHTHLTICLLKPDNYRVGRYQFRRWYKFFEKSLVRKQIRKKVLSWWLNMVNILTNTTNVGWRQNFESVFGENRWLWLLPVVAGGPVRLFYFMFIFSLLISLCREPLWLFLLPCRRGRPRKTFLLFFFFFTAWQRTLAHTWHIHTPSHVRTHMRHTHTNKHAQVGDGVHWPRRSSQDHELLELRFRVRVYA